MKYGSILSCICLALSLYISLLPILLNLLVSVYLLFLISFDLSASDFLLSLSYFDLLDWVVLGNFYS